MEEVLKAIERFSNRLDQLELQVKQLSGEVEANKAEHARDVDKLLKGMNYIRGQIGRLEEVTKYLPSGAKC